MFDNTPGSCPLPEFDEKRTKTTELPGCMRFFNVIIPHLPRNTLERTKNPEGNDSGPPHNQRAL